MQTNHLNWDSILRTLALAAVLVFGAWFMFGNNNAVAPSYETENVVTSQAKTATKTEKVCVDGSCVNVTAYDHGENRQVPAGFKWQGDLFDDCKAKGLHLYEDLTPDKQHHAGYHCAP